MTTNRENKRRRFRGHRTQHGAHRKWRGGGNRGGRGLAGGHKHKWSHVVKYDETRFGKHGFTRHGVHISKPRTISLAQIENMMSHFVAKKWADAEGGAMKVDLVKAGYDKVLGNGSITKPLIVHARMFSKQAESKLEEAGGKAVKV